MYMVLLKKKSIFLHQVWCNFRSIPVDSNTKLTIRPDQVIFIMQWLHTNVCNSTSIKNSNMFNVTLLSVKSISIIGGKSWKSSSIYQVYHASEMLQQQQQHENICERIYQKLPLLKKYLVFRLVSKKPKNNCIF